MKKITPIKKEYGDPKNSHLLLQDGILLSAVNISAKFHAENNRYMEHHEIMFIVDMLKRRLLEENKIAQAFA